MCIYTHVYMHMYTYHIYPSSLTNLDNYARIQSYKLIFWEIRSCHFLIMATFPHRKKKSDLTTETIII